MFDESFKRSKIFPKDLSKTGLVSYESYLLLRALPLDKPDEIFIVLFVGCLTIALFLRRANLFKEPAHTVRTQSFAGIRVTTSDTHPDRSSETCDATVAAAIFFTPPPLPGGDRRPSVRVHRTCGRPFAGPQPPWGGPAILLEFPSTTGSAPLLGLGKNCFPTQHQ